MKAKRNDIITGCLCSLGCETLYGLSFMFTKQATELASPLALVGWRFLVAVVVMSLCVMFGFIKINLKGKSLKPLLLVSLFSPSIYYITETIGISSTTASESGVVLACIPVTSLLASTLILKKKPFKLQIVGIAVTLIGVLITVAAVGTTSSLSFVGYFSLFAAVISYSLYCVFVDKASDYTGAEITYIMLVVGALVYVVLAVAEAVVLGNAYELVTLPFIEWGFMKAILYQGIGCSVVAFFLSNIAIAKIGVNRTSSFIGVSTVVAIVTGAVLLKESFTLYQIVGAVIIIGGVYIANAKIEEE